MPSRKALWWAPPSLVCWPLTKEKCVSPKLAVWLNAELEVLGLVIQGLIEGGLADFAGEEVQQTVPGYESFPVEDEGKSAVQAGVVPQPLADVIEVEREVIAEDLNVGQKLEIRPVGFARLQALHLLLQSAAFKAGFKVFSFPVRDCPEVGREGVDGLGAHAVEAHAELEDVVIVFRAGIDGWKRSR